MVHNKPVYKMYDSFVDRHIRLYEILHFHWCEKLVYKPYMDGFLFFVVVVVVVFFINFPCT